MQQPSYSNPYQQQQQHVPQQPSYPPPPPPPTQQQQQQQQPVYNPYSQPSPQQQYGLHQNPLVNQQQHQAQQQPNYSPYNHTPNFQQQQLQQQQLQPQQLQYQPQYQPQQQQQQLPPQYQQQQSNQYQPQYPNYNNRTHNQTNFHSQTRPPYTDPETKIVYHITNTTISGWLTKQSDWLKDWRRRYFILDANTSKLFFCKNEYSAPHGMIDLATCTTVKSADIKSGKRFSFEISTGERTYLMFADNEKEKDDWIGAVGKSIVRCSTTFLNNGSRKGPGKGGRNEEDDDDDDDDIYNNALFGNDNSHAYFND
mmetsp:Transcript_14625/g.17800  ORF Transcript_14625/g.17800 Transcript_14625/m.17800 type:complete len:311 (+) Transcript_14625:153-1085(+)